MFREVRSGEVRIERSCGVLAGHYRDFGFYWMRWFDLCFNKITLVVVWRVGVGRQCWRQSREIIEEAIALTQVRGDRGLSSKLTNWPLWLLLCFFWLGFPAPSSPPWWSWPFLLSMPLTWQSFVTCLSVLPTVPDESYTGTATASSLTAGDDSFWSWLFSFSSHYWV